ncbi:hypothetical protein D9M69_665410 [compost metagenome]
MSDPGTVTGRLAGGTHFVDVGFAHDLELDTTILQLGDGVDVSHGAALALGGHVLDVLIQAVAVAELVVLVNRARGQRHDLARAAGQIDHAAVADDQLDVR